MESKENTNMQLKQQLAQLVGKENTNNAAEEIQGPRDPDRPQNKTRRMAIMGCGACLTVLLILALGLLAGVAQHDAMDFNSITSAADSIAQPGGTFEKMLDSAKAAVVSWRSNSSGLRFGLGDEVMDGDGESGVVIAVDENDLEKPYNVRYANTGEEFWQPQGFLTATSRSKTEHVTESRISWDYRSLFGGIEVLQNLFRTVTVVQHQRSSRLRPKRKRQQKKRLHVLRLRLRQHALRPKRR